MAKRWYVLHVFSGSEKKVAQLITEQAESNGLEHQIEEVMVPTEDVVEVRRGVRVESERKFFPGYILVKMDLTDEAWQLVTSQPRVTGFLGGKGKPVPITNAEAERLIEVHRATHPRRARRPRPKGAASWRAGPRRKASAYAWRLISESISPSSALEQTPRTSASSQPSATT